MLMGDVFVTPSKEAIESRRDSGQQSAKLQQNTQGGSFSPR